MIFSLTNSEVVSEKLGNIGELSCSHPLLMAAHMQRRGVCHWRKKQNALLICSHVLKKGRYPVIKDFNFWSPNSICCVLLSLECVLAVTVLNPCASCLSCKNQWRSAGLGYTELRAGWGSGKLPTHLYSVAFLHSQDWVEKRFGRSVSPSQYSMDASFFLMINMLHNCKVQAGLIQICQQVLRPVNINFCFWLSCLLFFWMNLFQLKQPFN